MDLECTLIVLLLYLWLSTFALGFLQCCHDAWDLTRIADGPNAATFGINPPDLFTNQIAPNLAWPDPDPPPHASFLVKVANAIPPSHCVNTLAGQ
jgi:hypothetical protein